MSNSIFSEDAGESCAAKGENAFHVAKHKQPIHQRPAGRPVANIIYATRSAGMGLKDMRVMPVGVGTAQLHIHKTMRRIPLGDFGPPMDRDTVNTDPIINERAGPHRDGRLGEHLEMQPGRRDGFQIARFAEKSENFFTWTRQPLLSLKSEFLHRGVHQSFVRIPHARKTHQPRNASKATNTPDASRTTPSHTDEVKPNPAPTSSPSAPRPRMIRPLLSIFGEKSLCIASISRK